MDRKADPIIRNILFPLNTKLAERRIAAFDVETETIDGAPSFVCGSVYSEHTQKTYFDRVEMAKDLLGYKFASHWIFATMLDFDFFVTFPDWYKSDLIPTFRGSSLISVICENEVGSRKSRRFLDTMNYYPVGLNKLGECIDMAKLPRPASWQRKPKTDEECKELIAYNMNDAKMTYKWVIWFQKKLNSINCNMKNTIASTSLMHYRRVFQKTPIYQPVVGIMEDMLKGYYGGRTELFFRGSYNDRMYLYDANGMHAWAMTQEFPETSSLFIEEHPTLAQIEQYHGMTYCDIETPDGMFYPLLPFRQDDGKLIFPKGRFTGWHTNIELRMALRHDYDITPIKSYLYHKSHTPFKAIQELYYKKRRESGDMSLIYKLLSNSLYGKWAQRWDDTTVYTHITKSGRIPDEFLDIRDEFVLTKEKREAPNFINPIYSIYTTAYARLKLHDALIRYHGVYCDTDSCMTAEKMPESMELGGFKLERTLKKVILLRPKVYFIRGEDGRDYVKAKGMKLRSYEDFRFMIENGFFPVERMLRFKESVRRHKPVLFNVKFPKRFHMQDDKRIWNDVFDVEKWEMSAPITVQGGAEK